MQDARYFSNPTSFIPTRWIEGECGEETCNKAAWCPFSVGLRNCVGQPFVSLFCVTETFRLAMMELRTILASFVWFFDAEFVDLGQPEPFFKDAFTAGHGPLPIRIKPVSKRG
jgi:cytochrome P450